MKTKARKEDGDIIVRNGVHMIIITRKEQQEGIEAYLLSRKVVGEPYDALRCPVLAARTFYRKTGKVFDVVLTRTNSHKNGVYFYNLIIRDQMAITGGWVITYLDEKAAHEDYCKVDDLFLSFGSP